MSLGRGKGCDVVLNDKKASRKRRIAAGVIRYVVEAARPFIVPVTHQGGVRVHSVDDPVRTVTGAHRGELAITDVRVTGLGQADPEWHTKRAETEKDGAIVANFEVQILQPTAFSSVK